jgi:DNA repair protein RadC
MINSESAAVYKTAPAPAPAPAPKPRTMSDDQIIKRALSILHRRARTHSGDGADSITQPDVAADYCRLALAQQITDGREGFVVVFLDNRHRPTGSKLLSIGTIDGASVYPREVARAALAANAAAVILSHNHPSGDPSPSSADIAVTSKIKSALDTVSIRVLDHVVIGLDCHVSLTEKGLI